MEAIYEAILMIPHYPAKATKILNGLAIEKLHFLRLLKCMALELYDRFKPHNPETMAQYEMMSKQILVIFNRYIKTSFKEQTQNICLHIEELYEWMVEILSCRTISLHSKKTLETALTQIANSMCFKKNHFVYLMDSLTSSSIESAPSLFVYLQALLDSQVNKNQILLTIEESYANLYYIALNDLTRAVQFYRNCYMQTDCGQINKSNEFSKILKQNEYILRVICNFISFLYNTGVAQKYRYKQETLIRQILLSSDLALYISRILKIENQLFDHNMENLFDLKIIIANNLKTQEKSVINRLKSLSLTILKLILSLTDKDYNLVHTDKILLRELFNLGDLIINELITCSFHNVISALGEESSIVSIFSALFDVLSEIVQFTDMKAAFQRLNIEQVVRLTLGFMKSYESENKMYEQQVQQYFVFVYYILCGQMDEVESEIHLAIGEICIKKNVVQLIKQMVMAVEGFNSILMELCSDFVLLQMKLRSTGGNQYKEMFLVKYSLPENIFECFNLESVLFTFTVLLDKSVNEFEKRRKLGFLLETIVPSSLSTLQLCRVYVCLAVHNRLFVDRELQVNYFSYVQRVFKLEGSTTSIQRHAFYFLERLIAENKHETHEYSIFVDKILTQTVEWIKYTQCSYLIDFIIVSVQNKEVKNKVLNLSWINICVRQLNSKVLRQLAAQSMNVQFLSVTFRLYSALIKSYHFLIQRNEESTYPTFESQVNQFQELANIFLISELFQRLQNVLSGQPAMEQFSMIYNFCDVLIDLLVHDVCLNEQSVYLITNYSMFLLTYTDDIPGQYKTVCFQLLYQVINKNPYNMERKHYQVILNWMKEDIERENIDQIFLNRVCLILQLFYFFIEGNIFLKEQMIVFFSQITETIEKKFIKYLMNYKDYVNLIEGQQDPIIRKINMMNLQGNQITNEKKRKPITIIRLYNTVLMNPNFQPKSIHIIKDIIKFYLQETIPAYDLAVQLIALRTIRARSKNSGVVECFKIALQLLYYNYNHPQHKETVDQTEIKIRKLTQTLRSPISSTDPYAQLFDFINQQITQNKVQTVLLDYDKPIEDLQIDVIEFVKSDEYTLQLVKKLSSIRRVNNQPRIIRKIKREEDQS